jgi:long-chain fatty acid transport protein
MTAIVMSSFSRRGGTIAAKFAITLGVLGHGGAAQATDGYFLSGVGAKAKGEAGVAIALLQDALSIDNNPAAATELGDRLDGGIELFIPDRGATIRGNGAGADGNFSGNGANPFVLPEVGYVRPLSEKVAIGIALYGGGGMNTTYARNPFASELPPF